MATKAKSRITKKRMLLVLAMFLTVLSFALWSIGIFSIFKAVWSEAPMSGRWGGTALWTLILAGISTFCTAASYMTWNDTKDWN